MYKRQDWLLVTGGGNDFAECTCGVDCDDTLSTLISEEGDGAIPELVQQAISDGHQVAWAGYLTPMPSAESFSNCTGELEILAGRMERYADAVDQMVFVNGMEYGDGTNTELYAEDGYHPSGEGSAVIGRAIAAAMQ